MGKLSWLRRSAETSLGAAGMSACATSANGTSLVTLLQTFEARLELGCEYILGYGVFE
jgi:hypothetical protein